MGNSDSNCYEFRKEDKNKMKAKYVKGKNEKVIESAVDVPYIDSNSEHGNTKKECDSTFDAYTPVRGGQSNCQSSKNSGFFDPRSPSEGIYRTPLQVIEKSVPALDDPRSPTQGIDRTPIVKIEDAVKEESFNPVSDHSINPCSPALKIDGTPNFPSSASMYVLVSFKVFYKANAICSDYRPVNYFKSYCYFQTKYLVRWGKKSLKSQL